MQGWPKSDGNYILYFEVVLMLLFLLMNATDSDFQANNSGNIISQFIYPFFIDIDSSNLHVIERVCWWLHISGIFSVFKLSILFKTPSYIVCISKYLLR